MRLLQKVPPPCSNVCNKSHLIVIDFQSLLLSFIVTTIIQLLLYTSIDATTLGATADFDYASCGAYDDANGVWFTYIPIENLTITATVIDQDGGSWNNLRLHAGYGCDENNGENTNRNDDLECLPGFGPVCNLIANVDYKLLLS